MTRASAYIENPAFQIKLLGLFLSGANMAWFQLKTFKQADEWDNTGSTPAAARLAGATSLFLWVMVVFAGRWVGHII